MLKLSFSYHALVTIATKVNIKSIKANLLDLCPLTSNTNL